MVGYIISKWLGLDANLGSLGLRFVFRVVRFFVKVDFKSVVGMK